MEGLRLRVQGLGSRVWGLWIGVLGLGVWVSGSAAPLVRFSGLDFGFRVSGFGLGFRGWVEISGSGFRFSGWVSLGLGGAPRVRSRRHSHTTARMSAIQEKVGLLRLLANVCSHTRHTIPVTLHWSLLHETGSWCISSKTRSEMDQRVRDSPKN